MRRLVCVMLALSLFASLLFAATFSTPQPSYNLSPVLPATYQGPYQVIRTVMANDTPLTVKTKYWDAIAGTWFAIPPSWNHVELSFLAYGDGTGEGDPNAGSAKVKVMVARYRASAKTVFEGELGIGDLEASCDPESGIQWNSGSLDANESYKWADTIDANGLGDLWPSGVTLSDAADTTGNTATLSFDCTGYFKIFVQVTEKNGWTNLKPVITGY